MRKGVGFPYLPVPKDQPDAEDTIATPVSTTLYPILATTKLVRIYCIGTQVTWAVTQPNPIDVVVTIDGITEIFRQADPVTATAYTARRNSVAEVQQFIAANTSELGLLLEGQSVKVDVRITWATTQPTNLICRVQWAKW